MQHITGYSVCSEQQRCQFVYWFYHLPESQCPRLVLKLISASLAWRNNFLKWNIDLNCIDQHCSSFMYCNKLRWAHPGGLFAPSVAGQNVLCTSTKSQYKNTGVSSNLFCSRALDNTRLTTCFILPLQNLLLLCLLCTVQTNGRDKKLTPNGRSEP